MDWVSAFRLRLWTGERWITTRHETGLAPAPPGDVQWFDVDTDEVSAALIEVRRCGIDGWWTPWNLAQHAFLLEGEAVPTAPRRESTLELATCTLSGLPSGLTAARHDGAVHFKSDALQVGFYLGRAGFSHLSLSGRAPDGNAINLLHLHPGAFHQGVHLHPVGAAPTAAPALRYDVEGSTAVSGNQVTYNLRLGSTGQRYRLAWTIHPDRLTLDARRLADAPLRAWHSSAWRIGLRSTASPAHLLGRLQPIGETGAITLPAWLHAPAAGSMRIHPATDQAALAPSTACMRTNVYRSQDLITADLKLGEDLQPDGDYLLQAGRHTATLEWVIDELSPSLTDAAPPAVRSAVRRCGLTALTYRPDTATLSNNGASIHCPICMDNWAEMATQLGEVLPDLDASYFVRTSLERWLTGGPGYASGHLVRRDAGDHAGRNEPHGAPNDPAPISLRDAEDEYLMTGTAGLLGLALFLTRCGTASWLKRHRGAVGRKLASMQRRDLDGDGLIESPHRTGVSGSGQWSTCWLDVVSFGWKDAFANALLYPALTLLADALPQLGAPDLAAPLAPWAATLKANYVPTFYNEETGWLAGWRCAEDALHDYAFLPVNGAAVCGGLLEPETARSIMEALWAEVERIELPDPALGLPCNLHPIPDADRADILQGYPFGYYQNGGRTHSQARHVVSALYHVGMTEEADEVLERLCHGLATHQTHGGSKSGIDWRYWDDRPCGYEGLLTDQFGILAVALERYSIGRAREGL